MTNQMYPTHIVIADTIPDIKSVEWLNGDKKIDINDYYVYNKKEKKDIFYNYKISLRNKNINLNRITPNHIILSQSFPDIKSVEWLNGDKNSVVDKFFVFGKNFIEDIHSSDNYDYNMEYSTKNRYINRITPKHIVISQTLPDIKSETWLNGDKNSEVNNFYVFGKNYIEDNFPTDKYDFNIEYRNKNINLNRITPKHIILSQTIPDIKSEEWINGNKNSVVDNFFVFGKNFIEDIYSSDNYDYNIEYRKTANIVSTICFDKECKVLTNHGYVKLCNINILKHTINNNKIVAVTKTIYHGNELIIMKKGSLGHMVPSCNTIMTKEHCILFKGKLIPANKFVGRYNTINYDKRYVYNILLEEWSTMKVNNMIVETLNPKNITAQLYQTKEKMNEYIEAHNYAVSLYS